MWRSKRVFTPRGRGSVAVELDGIAVRVFDVDRGRPAPARDPHAGALHPLADLPPLGAREVQAEVVEAAGAGVERAPALDEVQDVVAPGRLEEDHPLVWERGLQPEDVQIEALGASEVPGPEREVAEPASHPPPSYPNPSGTTPRQMPLLPSSWLVR